MQNTAVGRSQKQTYNLTTFKLDLVIHAKQEALFFVITGFI